MHPLHIVFTNDYLLRLYHTPTPCQEKKGPCESLFSRVRIVYGHSFTPKVLRRPVGEPSLEPHGALSATKMKTHEFDAFRDGRLPRATDTGAAHDVQPDRPFRDFSDSA